MHRQLCLLIFANGLTVMGFFCKKTNGNIINEFNSFYMVYKEDMFEMKKNCL